MKKHLILTAICCFTFISSFAQKNIEMALWPEGVPESNGLIGEEIIKDTRISNISTPGMTVYPADPAKNTGVAILLCPGGAYGLQSATNEGSAVAQWLSENGITGIVLKYRLPNKHAYIPLKDAQQALRIIRSKAGEWNINPSKVGISGFSAGGHLAASAGTHFDLGKPANMKQASTINEKKTETATVNTFSCRPDFMILFYPVISMKDSLTHAGSRRNLLGSDYGKDSLLYYSNEDQVTKDTPPTLLFLSDDDKSVLPGNSVGFYEALKKNGIPASMYIFPEGGHGWGFKTTFRYHETWKTLYLDWLKQQKIIF